MAGRSSTATTARSYTLKAYVKLFKDLKVIQSTGDDRDKSDNYHSRRASTPPSNVTSSQASRRSTGPATAYRAVLPLGEAHPYNTNRRYSAIGNISRKHLRSRRMPLPSRKRHNKTDTVSTVEGQGRSRHAGDLVLRWGSTTPVPGYQNHAVTPTPIKKTSIRRVKVPNVPGFPWSALVLGGALVLGIIIVIAAGFSRRQDTSRTP